MRVATLIISLFLMLALGVQSCAVAAGGSLSEDLSTAAKDKQEASDIAGAGGLGILAALLWLVAAAFVLNKPRVSMWLFTAAAVFCLIGGGEGFTDLYIWAGVSGVFALTSWRGTIEKAKKYEDERAGGTSGALTAGPGPSGWGGTSRGAAVMETGSGDQPPAGWYQDPQKPGRLRWWDGFRWTEHRQAPQTEPPQQYPGPLGPGEPPVSTPTQQAVRPPEGKRPWYRRPWVIVVGAILALLIIVSALSSSVDNGGEQSSKKSQGANERAKANPEKPNEATGDYTPHVAPDEKVTVDGLVYEIKSAKRATALGDSSIGTEEKADGVFTVVKLSVHSTKGETAQLSDDTFRLEPKGGPSYSPDSEGSTAALLSSGSGESEEPFFLRDVQPDTTTNGLIVFDVPPRALKKKPEIRFNELGVGSTHGYIGLSSSGAGKASVGGAALDSDAIAAEEVVKAHWRAIERGDYRDAYGYLSANQQKTFSEAGWVQDHQQDALTRADVEVAAGDVGSSSATVEIRTLRTEAVATGCKDWSGYYQMVKEAGAWKLDKAKLTPASC